MRRYLKSPLCVTLAIVVLGVLTQSLQAFDHVYWNVWFKNRLTEVPTDAVIISLDDGAELRANAVASSTARQAALLDSLARTNARQIYIDSPQVVGEDPAGDIRLQAALARLGPKAIVVRRSKPDFANGVSWPLPSAFAVPVGVGQTFSVWTINFLGYAEHSDTTALIDGKFMRAAAVGDTRLLPADRHVLLDQNFDPRSVPVISARNVLNGDVAPAQLAGRRLFVTSTNPMLDTVVGYFGAGKVPAAIADISGARGYAKGLAVDLGWLPFLTLFAVAVIAGNQLQSRRGKLVVYSSLVAVSLVLPGLLREHMIVTSIGPALAAMLIYAPLRSSQKWRNRVQLTSSASGLPNIAAMATHGIDRTQDVVAVSVSQYEQMLASLPRELHGECARQIARRLSLGAGDRQIFDNDNGHFVWLEDSQTLDALVEHLDGLRALFSSPLVIGGHVLDTTVHFGVDRNIDSKPISRIQSALASANEAQGKSKLYEEFNEQRLAQSPWELSLHARIDEGLRNGDIWLALQPQYDYRHNRISGAEALIRWSDPVRGAIPPDAFILQAERAGRIEAITYWVLEKSIAMLDQLNDLAGPFQISVNLSARMVDHPGLVHRVADIVRESGLGDCSRITFEVTETFSMANREQAKRNLAALRAMGFRLSIDDFGTGQASLAYLAEIPSDEIKLDRRFVQAITTDERERLIVERVISLAHALGQEVVAEGIEDVMTLEALRLLDCDLAQGYHVARPMKLDELVELLAMSREGEGRGAAMRV